MLPVQVVTCHRRPVKLSAYEGGVDFLFGHVLIPDFTFFSTIA
jgi:hypothetical protein